MSVGILTIPQSIAVGRASIFLSFNYAAAGVLWGERVVKSPDPVEIAMFTDILKWRFDTVPSDTSLRGTANYLVWLCGIFQLQARALNGGGSVDPIPPTLMPNKIEFIVSGTSPIINGASTLTLPISWGGLGVIFNRSNLPQTSVNTEPTYFLWNTVTRQFSVSPAAVTGELFSINPV